MKTSQTYNKLCEQCLNKYEISNNIMKGAYLLITELKNDVTIHIGKLGGIRFSKGFYVYVGSALNGLEQRIKRHLRENKKTHWHIDYFLKHAKIINVFYKENTAKEECLIAKRLDKKLFSVSSFGCSDCTCKSHLFYGTIEEIKNIVDSFDMKIYSFDANH